MLTTTSTRSRSRTRAGLLVALALSASSCAEVTGQPPTLSCIPARPGARVATGELTKTTFTLVNESDRSVAFEARAPSCACVRVSRKRVEVPPRDRVPVELTIDSDQDGFRTVDIYFLLYGADQTTGMLHVPFQFWSGPDVYVAPNPLQVSGEVGLRTPSLLTVFVLLDDPGSSPTLSWRSSAGIQLVPESSELLSGSAFPIALSTFTGLLLDRPPGCYFEDLSLECR